MRSNFLLTPTLPHPVIAANLLSFHASHNKTRTAQTRRRGPPAARGRAQRGRHPPFAEVASAGDDLHDGAVNNRPRPALPAPWLLATALLLAAPATRAASDGPPWIGVEMAPGKAGGVLLRRVVPGAPADRARLRAGDEVVAVDGQKVATPEALARAVQGKPSGTTVRFRIGGDGGREVALTLEPRPDPVELSRRTLEGQPAPDFTAAPTSGPRFGKLSALKGRVVLLDFFATWCLPCMEALPRLAALSRELGPKGLTVIGISDEAPGVVAGVARRGAEYALCSDAGSEIGGRYQVRALPTLVVIDRRGVVRRVAVADEDAAEEAVRALLGARE